MKQRRRVSPSRRLHVAVGDVVGGLAPRPHGALQPQACWKLQVITRLQRSRARRLNLMCSSNQAAGPSSGLSTQRFRGGRRSFGFSRHSMVMQRLGDGMGARKLRLWVVECSDVPHNFRLPRLEPAEASVEAVPIRQSAHWPIPSADRMVPRRFAWLRGYQIWNLGVVNPSPEASELARIRTVPIAGHPARPQRTLWRAAASRIPLRQWKGFLVHLRHLLHHCLPRFHFLWIRIRHEKSGRPNVRTFEVDVWTFE